MTKLFRVMGDNAQPLARQSNREQVAAVCFQGKGADRQVLMITSRDTKRWIIPKGWPIKGLDAKGSAAQEAWEEAGVKPASILPDPLGVYEYGKRLENKKTVTCIVQVFAIEVDHLEDNFPEVSERSRKWVAPKQAAEMVKEPGLRDILLNF